jgi:hypothetical protein
MRTKSRPNQYLELINYEISYKHYVIIFCLYKLHGCWKHLMNQEILKVQKTPFIDRTPFEKVHLIFCKHLLGTKKTSSNIGVRAELGRFPVENFINSQDP